MVEKWLLVFLIVGLTSLIFFICFPIDFYLYRRRKRLARERVNLSRYQPPATKRAGQLHSRISMDTSMEEENLEHGEKAPYSKPYEHEQSGFVRLVNLFRKQKKEKLFKMQKISMSTSEMTSDIPTVTVTAEQFAEVDKGFSVFSVNRSSNSLDPLKSGPMDKGKKEHTIANIESHRLNSDVVNSVDAGLSDNENLLDTYAPGNPNYNGLKQPSYVFNEHSYEHHQVSVSKSARQCEKVRKDEYSDVSKYNTIFDFHEGVEEVSETYIAEESIEYVDQKNMSEIKITNIQSDAANESITDCSFDKCFERKTFSEANIDEQHNIHNTSDREMVLTHTSEPNLNMKSYENELADITVLKEPLSISYSELRKEEDANRHGLQVLYGRKRNNSVIPTDEDARTATKCDDESTKKKKNTQLSESAESATHRKRHKKKKRNVFFQKHTANSLLELSTRRKHSGENEPYPIGH